MGLQQRKNIVVFPVPQTVGEGEDPNARPSPRLARWHIIAALQAFDFILVTGLLIIAFGRPLGDATSAPALLPAEAIALGLILSLVLTMAGAYRYSVIIKPILSSSIVTIVCMGILGPLMLLVGGQAVPGNETRALLLAEPGALICVVTVTRLLAAWLCAGCFRSGLLAHTICLIGSGPEADACIEQLQGSGGHNRLLGYFRTDHCWSHIQASVSHLGNMSQLATYLCHQRVDEIIVATAANQQEHLSDLVTDLGCLPVVLSLWPGSVGLPMQKGSRGSEVPLLPLRRAPLGGWAWGFKEVQDRTLAAVLLLASLPVLLAISVAIRICSPGPVFYRQAREGYCGREFSIFKFRTMHVAKSEPTNRLVLTTKNDNRIFPLGGLLRRTSLDELPQLLNVLIGDMWLIGPRPHSPLATAGGRLYADVVTHYRARHRIKPGITGWAQINGWRGPTNTQEQIQQRVAHDLYYIDHWSPLLDMRVLLLTAIRGFVHKNAF